MVEGEEEGLRVDARGRGGGGGGGKGGGGREGTARALIGSRID